MPRHIVILFHHSTPRYRVMGFLIFHLARMWRAKGYQTTFLYGTKKFVPADACFLHVDLSVVPDDYIEFANRYPVVVNRNMTDIRKRRFSKNLLNRTSDFQGPVIVKTDLNFAGWPEKVANVGSIRLALMQLKRKTGWTGEEFLSKDNYRIFENVHEVPGKYFVNPDFIVEKFLPERSGKYYCINHLKFLGSVSLCGRAFSLQPISSDGSAIKWEKTDPHPEILKIRNELNMDYGKLDFCMHNGDVVLLDVNKTIGMSPRNPSDEFLAYIKPIASGIADFI